MIWLCSNVADVGNSQIKRKECDGGGREKKAEPRRRAGWGAIDLTPRSREAASEKL